MAEVDTSDPASCWDWPGATQNGGYGHVGAGRRGEGNIRVAVVVLEDKLGRPLKPGKIACHTCDRPPCANPGHLYEGTEQTNQQDVIDRGRRKIGGEDPRAKLSHADVVAIREDPRSHREIAAEHEISRSLVSMIRSGSKRKHG